MGAQRQESENKMCVNLKGYKPSAFGDSLKQCKFYTQPAHRTHTVRVFFFLCQSMLFVPILCLCVNVYACRFIYVRTIFLACITRIHTHHIRWFDNEHTKCHIGNKHCRSKLKRYAFSLCRKWLDAHVSQPRHRFMLKCVFAVCHF